MQTNSKNKIRPGQFRSVSYSFITVILLIIVGFRPALFAQSELDPNGSNTSIEPNDDSLYISHSLLLNDTIAPDSTIFINDSLAVDSVDVEEDSFLDAPIFYDARDSAVYDAINEKVLLYGAAVVKYEDIELEADYIEYSFAENMVYASGVEDSTGTIVGKPKFRDGDQEFEPLSLSYNFKTKKGYIEEVVTQDGEFYLHAQQTKRQQNEWVHLRNGKFTTCDKPNPHYHFHLTKAIVIPDDKVVSGPVIMKIRKVPTPLALPFGFFPNKRTSSHGILIPAYGNGGDLGYFFRDAGYYIPIGNWADTKILGDIYTRGSWTARNITSYRRRYKYNGGFNVSYSVLKRGLTELPSYTESREFFVRWQHTQDQKARPGVSFSAAVNAGSRNNFTNNINSSQQDYLTNTFQSNIRWSKSWSGKPYNLSVNMRHTQNSQTRNVDFTLPAVAFTVSRFYPLANLGQSAGKKKWYEMVGVNYSANFDNRLTAKDNEVNFQNFDYLSSKFRNGIRHTANINTSIKAGYVAINPSINITDRWYFDYLQLGLDEDLQQVRDTISGFRNAPDISMSVNANTKIYGTFITSRTGAIRAVRHVLTPSVGFSFRPDMGTDEFGYYGDGGTLINYNPYSIGIYGVPNSTQSGAVTFGILNNIEAKVRDKDSDSGSRKLVLIDNFRINSAYDLFRDSLNFSNFQMSAFTNLWENLSLNYNASYNPYDRDSLGRSIDQFLYDTQGKLARLTNASLAVNMNLRSSRRTGNRNTNNVTDEELEVVENNPGEFVDFTMPWNLNIAYSLRLNKIFDRETQRDTNRVTQSVLFNGDITLFKNWKVGVNSGYDFVAKELTPTTINLYWDLHCWEFTASYIPFGIRQSYSLQLNIKSSTLKDLKLQRRRNLGQNNLLL